MIAVRRRSPTGRPGTAAAAVLLVAACSSGDGGGASTADASTTTGRPATTAEPSASTTTTTAPAPQVQSYDVPAGSHPHDVAVEPDGTVWYTAQATGRLGHLDPASGEVDEVELGPGSRPHGVIVGPDGGLWVTDGGLNAIVRVDAETTDVRTFPLPPGGDADLNTAVFDPDGTLWFTGQAGVYGRLAGAAGDASGVGEVETFDAPGGRGPYGIAVTPDGDVYYASLAGNHLVRVDRATGRATVLQPPTPDQGTRRVWSDSEGRLWTSQWEAGQVAVYDPARDAWREWRLPGDDPQAYAVYVDDRDDVWLSDFGANALVRFEPTSGELTTFPLPSDPGEVRQIHGRPGEVWGAESAADRLVVVRTA